MSPLSTSKGFSLIEMLVYVAILVLMLVIVLNVIVSLVRSNRLITSARTIENSAALSLERVSRELRQADGVSTASSTLGVHPGRLVLVGTAGGAPRTVEFSLSGDRILLMENGEVSGFLTESGARVTSLVFRRFATSTVEGVRAEMTLESGTSTAYRTETFYSSTILR